MNYIKLKKHLKNFLIFTQKDIKKLDPSFCRQNLKVWQDKDYIKKIIKGYYIFSDFELNERSLYAIANKIFKPSYISFESALSFYKLIPESIYSITSASSRNTYKFKTSFGDFMYRKIKPKLMFGYKLIQNNNEAFNIAEAEKAILDYFYIRTHIKNNEDFEELRIDKRTFFEKINTDKLKKYVSYYKSPTLKRRINKFVRYMENA